jgi:hypothetical protein
MRPGVNGYRFTNNNKQRRASPEADRALASYRSITVLGAYWLYQIPLWVVIFLFLLVLLFPMEIGFRMGARYKRLHPDRDGEVHGDVTLTAMLTLLALMLAFTYSFSMSRADLRKQAHIAEVNTLGTAFLRADLLPEPGRSEVRQRLYGYTKSRYVEPGTITTLEEMKQVVIRSEEIQSTIWPAVKSALRQPGDMTDPERALLVSAINDVLDAHTTRMAVIYDRLPTAVLALMVLIAGTALGVAAFNSSLSGYLIRWRMTVFAFILASLMYLILDYDMMMRGFIQVDHSSLIGLMEEMKAALDH